MLRFHTLRICVLTLLTVSAASLSAQNFQVQIASFTDSVSMDYFSDRGLQTVYRTVDQNGLFRYYAGAYKTREEAETVVEQLKIQGFVYADIIDLEEQRVLCGTPCNFNKGEQQYTEDPSQTLTVRQIYFDSGSYKLSQDALAELDYIHQVLQHNPGTELRILGYTDGVGNVDQNIELAKNRCRAARNLLISKGTHAKRLYAKVFGELVAPAVGENPSSEDTFGKDSKQGQKLNRRVVLVVVAPNGEVQNNSRTKTGTGRK